MLPPLWYAGVCVSYILVLHQPHGLFLVYYYDYDDDEEFSLTADATFTPVYRSYQMAGCAFLIMLSL